MGHSAPRSQRRFSKEHEKKGLSPDRRLQYIFRPFKLLIYQKPPLHAPPVLITPAVLKKQTDGITELKKQIPRLKDFNSSKGISSNRINVHDSLASKEKLSNLQHSRSVLTVLTRRLSIGILNFVLPGARVRVEALKECFENSQIRVLVCILCR